MYKRTFSTILLLYFFSRWKQGIAGWTALSSPGAPLVVMATTCDATGGIWGRWLCGLWFSLFFSAWLIWHLHPIYRDSHVTEMQTMLCILVLLSLKNLLLSHKLSFEYESRGSSFWRLWRHHELSLRQLALPSVTAGLSVWWSFIFNAWCTSFKCLIYVLNLNSLYCLHCPTLNKVSLLLLLLLLFSRTIK